VFVDGALADAEIAGDFRPCACRRRQGRAPRGGVEAPGPGTAGFAVLFCLGSVPTAWAMQKAPI
jgi:hypothetical protein